MIRKESLLELYINRSLSARVIANQLGCSENKVNYWLKKHQIPKRTISDAIYLQHNPSGDPFTKQKLMSSEEWFLFGLGLGLYWGEGTKRNTHSVRLGNSDPDLIRKFIQFLQVIYDIDVSKLRFGLQVFSDMSPHAAQQFWVKKLGVSSGQFYKVTVTPTRGVGNYRTKTRHGVLTVYFNNKKLRDIIVGAITQLHQNKPS